MERLLVKDPPCNWAPIANDDNPCYGDVSLVVVNDPANGDQDAVYACEGHRRMVQLGFYLNEGEPMPEDTDPDAEPLSVLWATDPGDDPEDGGPCTTS